MVSTTEIILLLIAYLIGSIPTSVWVGRAFYGIDVREFGSGNAGATNTFRVLGKKAGIPVLIIDVLKGYVAVLLANLYTHEVGSNPYINLQLALGVASLVGHIFPVYVGFRGGKGVATILGVVLAVQPQAAGLSILVFLAVLLSSRYVSLSSMLSGLSYPIFVLFVFHTQAPSLIVFSFLVAAMLIITHKRNIQRLIKRQENKVKLFASSKIAK